MKILLAVDGSSHADAAAAEVAARPWPPGSRVRVLYVAPTPMLPPAGNVPPLAATMGPTASLAFPAVAADVEKELSERAAARARELAEQLGARGLSAEFKLREGDARSEIVDEASEWPADVIVMASHGRTGLQRWLLGSVAQSVVAHAPCSVEVVRPPRAAKP